MRTAKPVFKRLTCLFFFALMLIPISTKANAAYATGGSSAEVIRVALQELDYKEGDNNNVTKYGKWYGYTNAYWCDMFVSWCASQAGVPKSVFPRNASTTNHVKQFKNLGVYHVSQARGGDYIPQQGDLVFFYDNEKYPKTNVNCHVGLVLYVEGDEVFTIEGNTQTDRKDQPYLTVSHLVEDDVSIQDYVVIRHWKLSEPFFHGYASPRYADRTPIELGDYIDLSIYADAKPAIEDVVNSGIMTKTSAHTFSPRYGMTRGEFIAALMKLFELTSFAPATEVFADVKSDSPYYQAVASAKTIGIVNGGGDGMFFPDRYISGAEVQAFISRMYAHYGIPDRAFEFTIGDLSMTYTPYTTRGDIAKALYVVSQDWQAYKAELERELAEQLPEETEPFVIDIEGVTYLSEFAIEPLFADAKFETEMKTDGEAEAFIIWNGQKKGIETIVENGLVYVRMSSLEDSIKEVDADAKQVYDAYSMFKEVRVYRRK